MTNQTDKIVSLYVEGMKATYEWARRGDTVSERGLAMGADAARKACAGKLKLEGDCWMNAIHGAGFTGPYTAKALASFCGEG